MQRTILDLSKSNLTLSTSGTLKNCELHIVTEEEISNIGKEIGFGINVLDGEKPILQDPAIIADENQSLSELFSPSSSVQCKSEFLNSKICRKDKYDSGESDDGNPIPLDPSIIAGANQNPSELFSPSSSVNYESPSFNLKICTFELGNSEDPAIIADVNQNISEVVSPISRGEISSPFLNPITEPELLDMLAFIDQNISTESSTTQQLFGPSINSEISQDIKSSSELCLKKASEDSIDENDIRGGESLKDFADSEEKKDSDEAIIRGWIDPK